MDSVPVVLFAGEATHRSNYGTVHGACSSGKREAERILKNLANSHRNWIIYCLLLVLTVCSSSCFIDTIKTWRPSYFKQFLVQNNIRCGNLQFAAIFKALAMLADEHRHTMHLCTWTSYHNASQHVGWPNAALKNDNAFLPTPPLQVIQSAWQWTALPLQVPTIVASFIGNYYTVEELKTSQAWDLGLKT